MVADGPQFLLAECPAVAHGGAPLCAASIAIRNGKIQKRLADCACGMVFTGEVDYFSGRSMLVCCLPPVLCTNSEINS